MSSNNKLVKDVASEVCKRLFRGLFIVGIAILMGWSIVNIITTIGC